MVGCILLQFAFPLRKQTYCDHSTVKVFLVRLRFWWQPQDGGKGVLVMERTELAVMCMVLYNRAYRFRASVVTILDCPVVLVFCGVFLVFCDIRSVCVNVDVYLALRLFVFRIGLTLVFLRCVS